MTELERLSDNFHLVMGREPALTERLYERFFEKHPDARELFGDHSLPTQQQMLLEMVAAVIDNLSNEDWVKTNMKLLGDKHRGYDVASEMYGWWLDCVLEVLAEISAEEWDHELERSWREQLQRLNDWMNEP